jgi:hypothetical protein
VRSFGGALPDDLADRLLTDGVDLFLSRYDAESIRLAGRRPGRD